MWSTLLALTLLAALNPVRLGVTLLVISRPRPVQNLLAYWVGCLIPSVPYVLVPLMLLHVTPMLKSFAEDLSKPTTAVGSTVRHIQIGVGVFSLAVAAVLIVRFLVRPRAQLPTSGGDTSTMVLESDQPSAVARLLGRARDTQTEGGSAIRRLLRRVHKSWESGSLWLAFVIGIGFGPPAPEEVLYVLAIVVAAGVGTGTQVSAAIVFVVGMLAAVEIALASYLVIPAKTQALVQRLHDWARTHRRKILVAMCIVAGVSLVANGMGSV
ncbi:GAP family protein [Mycobacterium noviomagense]|uniref:Gap protein n=1 Tax=Mycobacterium noviomagense TaxID=459858 RepID=A0A7I7PCC6_9MYCO|nr:GAP family protein [Mycobacterium noviomagense]ORB11007.1 gap protein [Mycobacterium noviomagense]BBY06273.1 hypothetical protein MNVI_15910 [Mycobacterium noviomagense]